MGDRARSPAFQFSVLTCHHNRTLCKTINADGTEVPFGNAKNFLFKYCEIDLLEDFAKALDWLAEQPCKCIIRGKLKEGLTGWQRRLLHPDRDNPATLEEDPLRRWVGLDHDGVDVPEGLGAADRVADAGVYIRDKMLPLGFRGVRCVVAATASTGRKGPRVARLRFFFGLAEAVSNAQLVSWIDILSRSHPELRLDPSVMRVMQPIYTARPIFRGCSDPIPREGRVAVLDGDTDVIEVDLKKVRKRKAGVERRAAEGRADRVAARCCGEASDKAWRAIRKAFEALDGCGIKRHDTLNMVAWKLARLSAEGEMTEELARRAFMRAAKWIDNRDKIYDEKRIERHINDAFADLGRR